MTSITPIRSKLAKAVAMLTSDQDEERRAAFRALIRMLIAADRGVFLDLARLIDPSFGTKKGVVKEIGEKKYSEADLQQLTKQIYDAGFAEGQQFAQQQA